jgi:putative endonuclease
MSRTKSARKRRAVNTRWFVYMLECRGGRIYTGIALDVAARFEKHCAGTGAAYTRSFKPLRVLAAMRCASRSAALKAEYVLKQLPRPGKLVWAKRWRAKRLSKASPAPAARGKFSRS